MDHSARRRTRRDVVRLLSLGALALPVALRPWSAGAILGWCRRDPTVEIDGQIADILLSSYLEMLELATGPSKVVVTVPQRVSIKLLGTDEGFAGFGYDVRLEKSRDLEEDENSIDVRIDVFSPARDGVEGPLPLLVEFIPRGAGRLVPGQAEGLANQWVRLLAAGSADPPPPDPDDRPKDKPRKKPKKRRGRNTLGAESRVSGGSKRKGKKRSR